MQESKPLLIEQPWWQRAFPNNEWALLALLLFEVAIFSVMGSNFLTRANGFELVRLSVEIGLLALALTPIIITGGIDLSVGSLMGLTVGVRLSRIHPRITHCFARHCSRTAIF